MSLFDSFKDIYDKVFTTDTVSTDNLVFKLHYRATVTALVIFSVVLSLGQYAGDPIDCFSQGVAYTENFMDNYCWVAGTFTNKLKDDSSAQGESGKQLDHICDPTKSDKDDPDPKDCWHHQYYQWVALFIIVQAGFFYVPKYLWSTWENGKISSLVNGLDKTSLVKGIHDENDAGDKLKQLVENLVNTKGQHDIWAWKFYGCELLTLANLFLQYFITNKFLQGDGHFRQVALQGWSSEEHVSVLPITGLCYIKTGAMGGGYNHDYPLCVLPLNMINQKYFSFLYVWLAILVILTVGSLTLRLLMALLPDFRITVLNIFYGIKVDKRHRIHRCTHGDWHLMSYLVSNMNPLVGAQFLEKWTECEF